MSPAQREERVRKGCSILFRMGCLQGRGEALAHMPQIDDLADDLRAAVLELIAQGLDAAADSDAVTERLVILALGDRGHAQ